MALKFKEQQKFNHKMSGRMDNPEIASEEAPVEQETAPEEVKICMETVYKVIDSFPNRSRRYLIPMLSKIQEKLRWMPDGVGFDAGLVAPVDLEAAVVQL